MKIIVDPSAYDYLSKEMELEQGDAVRFFVKYGGESSIQEGFSLGITKDHPRHSLIHQFINGVDFFIEEDDQWYFDEYNLHVVYQQALEEIAYQYEKNSLA